MAVSSRAVPLVWGLITIAMCAPAHAQSLLDIRSFEVTPFPTRATVGDSITLSFRLHINERDLLTDSVPRPPEGLPPGVRVISVERLRRGTDRAFTGRAMIALYRPGVREIPSFAVPWVQIVTGHRGVVTTAPATVEIVPVLAPGNPTLRDIREPEPRRGPGLLLIAAGAAGGALAAWLVVRWRRHPARPAPAPSPEAAPAPPPATPYDRAIARLGELEASPPVEGGELAPYYEGVADVLRGYLEAAEGLPARERTTSELLWALPPRLGEAGLRRRLQDILGEADLVKFARARPGPAEALVWAREARSVLERWHAAAAPEEELHAAR